MTRRGFTMIELLVTVVLIGIVLTVAPLAFRNTKSAGDGRAELLSARRLAIRQGVSIRGTHDSTGRYAAQPDGSMLTDSLPPFRMEGGTHAP